MGIVFRLFDQVTPMPPADADFSFKIEFHKGAGDPRRIFDAASRFIDGLEDLDAAVAGAADSRIKTLMVLEDVTGGSLRVFLKTILQNIDDGGLREGEWKKAIGPALVHAKQVAIEYLDKDDASARSGADALRETLREIASDLPTQSLLGAAPLHEGRLISSLDKIQDAKRLLSHDKDKLEIDIDGKTYSVDLTKTWEPSEAIKVPPAEIETSQKETDAEIILTVRKPDLLGNAQWQFWHGKFPISAAIRDDSWLADFHARKIPLLPGDALVCMVKFTYVLDEKGMPIEQKTEITKVIRKIDGGGPRQTSLFDD